MAERTSWPSAGTTPGHDYSNSPPSASQQTTGTNSGLIDRVRGAATAQLDTQKDKATEGLGTVASAVRQTTQALRDQQHDTVANYVEQAADQIERISQQLKNKDVGQLLDDAQRLARRQPALFIGGAFAIGLVGARFFKSSAPDSHDAYGYDRNRTSGSSASYGSTPRTYTGGADDTLPRPATSRSTGVGSSFGSTAEGRRTENF